MSQSEYTRSPQQSRRHRPVVALIVVVVLCLAAFSVGIFVGKQRQKVSGVAVDAGAPVTHQAASKPDVVVVGGEALVVQAKEGFGAPVGNVTTLAVGEETSTEAVVAAQAAVAQQQSSDPLAKLTTSVAKSPLGSGMNSAPVMAKVTLLADSTVKPAIEKTTTAVVVPDAQQRAVARPAANASSVSGTVVYVVQVGSFKKRVDAEKVQLKLQKDYSVLVRNVDLGAKGIWFRVLVGTSSTKKDAVQLKEQLRSRYKMSGFVKKTTL